MGAGFSLRLQAGRKIHACGAGGGVARVAEGYGDTGWDTGDTGTGYETPKRRAPLQTVSISADGIYLT